MAAQDKSGDIQIKQAELALKEREIAIKEAELQIKAMEAQNAAPAEIDAAKNEIALQAMQLQHDRELFEKDKQIAALQLSAQVKDVQHAEQGVRDAVSDAQTASEVPQ